MGILRINDELRLNKEQYLAHLSARFMKIELWG
jgi:hypothetical protein